MTDVRHFLGPSAWRGRPLPLGGMADDTLNGAVAVVEQDPEQLAAAVQSVLEEKLAQRLVRVACPPPPRAPLCSALQLTAEN